MSFADDLNSVAKTPQQVADEKKKWAIELGEQDAKTDYDSIKNKFKDMASSGQYRTVNGKKYIEFEFEHGCFARLFDVKDSMRTEKQLFGCKAYSEVCYIANNQDKLSAYLAMLDKLSKTDGVSLNLTGRYQTYGRQIQYFTIPGRLTANDYSASKIWTKAVIVCKMSF